MLTFRTAMCSCMPVPTKRSRAIEIASCGSAPVFAFRRKNEAEKCCTRPDESSSGREPSRRRTSRERKRVSAAKKPLVSAAMSPRSSQMQKVEPSRMVRTEAIG